MDLTRSCDNATDFVEKIQWTINWFDGSIYEIKHETCFNMSLNIWQSGSTVVWNPGQTKNVTTFFRLVKLKMNCPTFCIFPIFHFESQFHRTLISNASSVQNRFKGFSKGKHSPKYITTKGFLLATNSYDIPTKMGFVDREILVDNLCEIESWSHFPSDQRQLNCWIILSMCWTRLQMCKISIKTWKSLTKDKTDVKKD